MFGKWLIQQRSLSVKAVIFTLTCNSQKQSLHMWTHTFCVGLQSVQCWIGAESWQDSPVALADPLLCNSIPKVTHCRARGHTRIAKHQHTHSHTQEHKTKLVCLNPRELRNREKNLLNAANIPSLSFSLHSVFSFSYLSEDQPFRSLLSDLAKLATGPHLPFLSRTDV